MKGQTSDRGRDRARPGAGLARKLTGLRQAQPVGRPRGKAGRKYPALGMGGEIEPSLWLREEMWRHVFEWDAETAGRLRWWLYKLGLYPSGDLRRAEYRHADMNHRGALHVIVDELDRADAAALFDVARLLAVVKRERTFFARIARDEEAWIRRAEVWGGIGRGGEGETECYR